MIQKTSKNYKYNFINVTHILHKLFDALATSRLILTLPTYVVGILICLFFLVVFQTRKDNRIDEMLTHCSGFVKLHFHLPF
jgi:hypothetical protein